MKYYRGLSETPLRENYMLMKKATMNNNYVKQNARGAKILVYRHYFVQNTIGLFRNGKKAFHTVKKPFTL